MILFYIVSFCSSTDNMKQFHIYVILLPNILRNKHRKSLPFMLLSRKLLSILLSSIVCRELKFYFGISLETQQSKLICQQGSGSRAASKG